MSEGNGKKKKRKTIWFSDREGQQFMTAKMIDRTIEVRDPVVLELQAINTEFGATKRREKRLMMYLQNPIHKDGLSIHEIAIGFFGRIYEKNLRYALQLARQLLCDTNKYLLKKKIFALKSVKEYVEELQKITNRIILAERTAEYEPKQRQKIQIIEKMGELDEAARETYKIPLATRRKRLAKILEQDEDEG